ncbi:MAG TPA: GNAT family N-acetyltransferase [Longimicrobiales bacterium]
MPEASVRAPSIGVTEITDPGALEALRPDWARLWERCPDATPFQSPDWLLSWWNVFGRGRLLALIVHRRDRLVGLAPFFVDGGRPSGAEKQGSVRRVLFLGTGVTDHLDCLLEPDYADAGAAAILAHLAAIASRWDILDLHQLRPGSALLRAPLPPGWSERLEDQESCPVLALPSRVEDLPAAGATLAERVRYYRRRAERIAPLRFETAEGRDIGRLLEEFFRLHAKRWSVRGQPGALADAAVRAFHRRAAAGLAERGVLRLHALWLGTDLAAVFYGFLHRRRACAYLAGFEPRFASLSVGAVLLGHAIEEAIREGATEFDFLRGREEYKYRWGARDCWSRRRVLRHAGAQPSAQP